MLKQQQHRHCIMKTMAKRMTRMIQTLCLAQIPRMAPQLYLPRSTSGLQYSTQLILTTQWSEMIRTHTLFLRRFRTAWAGAKAFVT